MGFAGGDGQNFKFGKMKIIIGLLLVFGLVHVSSAQRSLNPRNAKGKKGVFGGAEDFKEYRYSGLQLSIGPTFTIPTHRTPVTQSYSFHGGEYKQTKKPNGLPGIMAEVGMVHFPKRSKLSIKAKYIFISYIDWGVGVKLLRGLETTTLDQISPIAQQISSESGKFDNLFASVRFTVHKNFYIGKKYFIDNGFGVNADFNFLRKENIYTTLNPTYFHHPLMIHFHYELGFGIKLSRRSMLVPSVQVPIFGFHEWRKGASDFKWFDSNYYPMHFKIKWTYLFEKKVKGCAPARVNDQDKNTMNNH